MNILIYAGIFVCKIIEDALATLRIIVVSNGKKVLGAILQFIIALIWVIVTGTVITNIQEDPLKILFFALGSLFGSYIGSYIEEKIALGSNVLMVEVDTKVTKALMHELRSKKCRVNRLKSGKENHELLMIAGPRKKAAQIMAIIRSYDKEAIILTEKVKIAEPPL